MKYFLYCLFPALALCPVVYGADSPTDPWLFAQAKAVAPPFWAADTCPCKGPADCTCPEGKCDCKACIVQTSASLPPSGGVWMPEAGMFYHAHCDQFYNPRTGNWHTAIHHVPPVQFFAPPPMMMGGGGGVCGPRG